MIRARHYGGLAVLLLATAVLYVWNLGASGWANAFYSAAAQAGSESWTAWLFGSSDAANAITVDKTPAALWVTGLSARLFGVNPWSILLPQALAGVAAVGGVVRRGATGQRAVGGAVRRCGSGADPGGGADVPVQQSRCAAGAFACRRRLLHPAVTGPQRGSGGGCRWPVSRSGSGSWPRCCRRSWCCPLLRWCSCSPPTHRCGPG